MRQISFGKWLLFHSTFPHTLVVQYKQKSTREMSAVEYITLATGTI